MVAFARGHKSVKVIIAFAEQSVSCLDISSETWIIMKYISKYSYKNWEQ